MREVAQVVTQQLVVAYEVAYLLALRLELAPSVALALDLVAPQERGPQLVS